MQANEERKVAAWPSFAVPLVGGVVNMVLNPFRFWEDQQKMSFPGTSSALTHIILAGSWLHVYPAGSFT